MGRVISGVTWCAPSATWGAARFDKALAGFDGRDDVEVVYHAFELDPSWPRGQTMPTMEMLATKYQLSPADAEAAESRVAGLAQAEGLGFRADRVLGNTFDLHRVLRLAADQGFQHRLLDAIYQAYFGQAADVFDPDMLAKLAEGAGLDPDDVHQVLDSGDYTAEVRDGRGTGPSARHQRGAVLRARRPPRAYPAPSPPRPSPKPCGRPPALRPARRFRPTYG